MKTQRAEELLVVSGGLDSTVLAYSKVRGEGRRAHAIYFDVATFARSRELASLNLLSADLNLPVEKVDLRSLRDGFLGHLGAKVASIGEFINKGERVPKVMVGLGGFASLATMSAFYAQAIEVEKVSFGLLEEDVALSPGLPDFLDGLGKSLAVLQPALPQISFELPFAGRSKGDVVRLGVELGVPFEDTWSCEVDGRRHCGRCEPCRQRRVAFEQSGVADVTAYAA